MPNLNRTYDVNFNILMDKECDEMLIRLAADLDLSKAAVCRALIRRHHQMKYARTPVCADGQLCRCPHAHIYAPTQPPADLDQDSANAH